MNSKRVLSRLLCKYNRNIQIYPADKLLGISYTSSKDYVRKEQRFNFSTKNEVNSAQHYKIVFANKNRRNIIGLLCGIGFCFVTTYTAFKNGWLTVKAEQGVENIDTEGEKTKTFPKDEENNENAAAELHEEELEKEEVRVFPDVDLPEHIPYLIIGGGMAAKSAYMSIRLKEPRAKVLLISAEGENPYIRPLLLDQELWLSPPKRISKVISSKTPDGNRDSVYLEHHEYYESIENLMKNEGGGIAVLYGKKAVKIDASQRRVYLDNGKEIAYDKCLIATGGTPKSLRVFDNADQVVKDKTTSFRNISDFKRIYAELFKGQRIAVVGGGFIGTELAHILGGFSEYGIGSVVEIISENGNMSKVLPQYLSEYITKKLKRQGVEVFTNSYVKIASTSPDGKIKLVLNTDEEVIVDYVVTAVGIEPNVDLAVSSGLEIDEKHGGFRVNAELEARSNLWVAGDVACFHDLKFGRRRVEHIQHAIASGKLAGENMAGAGKPYLNQSKYIFNLYPPALCVGVGLVDASFPTVGVFVKETEKNTPKAVEETNGEGLHSEIEKETQPAVDSDPKSNKGNMPLEEEVYKKGVIFYLRDDVIVGILLWNVYDKHKVAERIIKEAKTYDNYLELAKLFNYTDE